MKASAREALEHIERLLVGGFTGEIVLRCTDGGVKDWTVTIKHRLTRKS